MNHRKIRAHEAEVNCVRYNPENTICATGSTDKKLHIWDMRSRNQQPVQTLNHAKDGITSISIDSHEIAASSLDGCVRQYDIRAGKMRTDNLGGHCMSVSYSNDENCLLVQSLDNKCRLFDKMNGELLNVYKEHKNSKYKTQSVFSKDDSLIIVGSEDHNVYIYDLVDANVKYVLKVKRKERKKKLNYLFTKKKCRDILMLCLVLHTLQMLKLLYLVQVIII